jgi:hypothetical protein
MRTEHIFRGVHAGSGQYIWSGSALEPKILGRAIAGPVLRQSIPRRMVQLLPYCAPTVLHACFVPIFQWLASYSGSQDRAGRTERPASSFLRNSFNLRVHAKITQSSEHGVSKFVDIRYRLFWECQLSYDFSLALIRDLSIVDKGG